MNEKEFDKLQDAIQKNELYQQSASMHKDLQYRQFMSNDKPLDGQQIREEDSAGHINGDPDFDNATKRPVLYNFKNGLLHSENGEPAIQYPGHWEMWNNGTIERVVANGGDIEEHWKDGVPVQIDRGLSGRRNKKDREQDQER